MLAFLLTGCGTDPNTLTTGKQLFEHYCVTCHGIAGTGVFLKGIPANIVTDKNLSSIIVQIQQGSKPNRTGTKMPAFPNISDSAAKKIALHLLLLKKEYLQGKHRDKILLTPK